MTFVIVLEQNWPQMELLTPFLSLLKNYFEDNFVCQICGELKVLSFSKITMMTVKIIASE